MSLDPSRAARVRHMVLDRSTWPSNVLHMKRIEGDCIVEYGVIFRAELPVGIQPNHGAHITFKTLDDLINAGWAVD